VPVWDRLRLCERRLFRRRYLYMAERVGISTCVISSVLRRRSAYRATEDRESYSPRWREVYHLQRTLMMFVLLWYM